jgi:hypothetical protein
LIPLQRNRLPKVECVAKPNTTRSHGQPSALGNVCDLGNVTFSPKTGKKARTALAGSLRHFGNLALGQHPTLTPTVYSCTVIERSPAVDAPAIRQGGRGAGGGSGEVEGSGLVVKQPRVALAIVVIVLLACVAAWQARLHERFGDYLLQPLSFQPHARLAFTSEAWSAATPKDRGSMVRAMFAAHDDLRGMSRPKVIALLGKPDKNAPRLFWYYVSDEPGSAYPSLWALIIWIRDDEIVEKAAVQYIGD